MGIEGKVAGAESDRGCQAEQAALVARRREENLARLEQQRGVVLVRRRGTGAGA